MRDVRGMARCPRTGSQHKHNEPYVPLPRRRDARMTAQQLLVAYLDYRRIMTSAGVHFSEESIRAMNGLTDYLCVQTECEGVGCGRPECCSGGVPYSVD